MSNGIGRFLTSGSDIDIMLKNAVQPSSGFCFNNRKCSDVTVCSLMVPTLNEPIHMKRELEQDEMTCVAQDLSMSSCVKKARKEPVTEFDAMMEHSRLPEGTFLKTGVILQVMDIKEPLETLRYLLERRLRVDLSCFQIWLQDKSKLQPQKSLGDQCIQSKGLAQVKLELKQRGGHNRINIIDVLKYPYESSDEEDAGEDEGVEIDDSEDSYMVEDLSMKKPSKPVENNENVPSKWTIYEDINSLFPIPLPRNPADWTEIQIQHWLRWAMQEFQVDQVSDSMWNVTGEQLCQMTIQDFQKIVPNDPQNLLWTHIELLRKCRIFAVVDKSSDRIKHSEENIVDCSKISVKKHNSNSNARNINETNGKGPVKRSYNGIKKPRTPSSSSASSTSTSSNGGASNGKRPFMTGHNGQIQLWQFLLELLSDPCRKNVIQWVGTNGEFKLNDPELVAQMWGERKNKPKMNYEKLSRALRYYYSESMIAKVHGRRFVYKFVCNLKELIGHSTEELISMVAEDLTSISN